MLVAVTKVSWCFLSSLLFCFLFQYLPDVSEHFKLFNVMELFDVFF